MSQFLSRVSGNKLIHLIRSLGQGMTWGKAWSMPSKHDSAQVDEMTVPG